MNAASPLVLVVDDHPDEQRSVFKSPDVRYEVLHPEEVDQDLLNQADLVLVDYLIDDWQARSLATQIGLRTANGIALATVLREQADLKRATGFAIHTGRPDALWLMPAEPRRHLIARAYNLEWVFLKSESSNVVAQTSCLARAIKALPSAWPGDDHALALTEVEKLLGFGSEEDDSPRWAASALFEVESCRPPLTELSVKSHGLVFLRWLLQRILPYPCFLLDNYRLAARLRIKHADLAGILAAGLDEKLKPYRYSGVLSGFLGDRWWRAGIEDFLWDLTGGASLPANEQRLALGKLVGQDLTTAATDHTIVCIDENYRTLPETYPSNAVVRIQPDDWPVFAQQAWTTIASARESHRLATIVVTEDQDKLSLSADGGQA